MATHCLRAASGRVAAAFVASVLAAAFLRAQTAAAADGAITVLLDQAKVARLPGKAQTLIVGNPIIADVTLIKDSNVMVITGKGFGETNLVVLDKDGHLLTEEIIRVKADTRSLLVVQRGMERESYTCSPRCEPTVQLGDAVKYNTETGKQISARNELATGTGGKN